MSDLAAAAGRVSAALPSTTATPSTTLGSSHRRLHVLHVGVAADGAVASIVTGLVRDQIARGWHVSVACPTEGRLGYDARALGARVRWWEAEHGAGTSVVAEMARLIAIVESVNPDVVHLHGAKAGLVGRLAVRDSVVTVVSPYSWSFLADGEQTRAEALRWERFATRWTSALVCPDEPERDAAAERGVQVEPTLVVAHGVDLEAFAPHGETERRARREQLGLRAVPTAVCVGRLALSKGQADLLDVWPAVRERVPHAELILVGDGPDRASLVHHASRLRGVSLTGRRSDVADWYAAADVVVAPSRWEGTGLVTLEAMASSRSVVATDLPRHRAVLPPEAGALVDPNDAAALTDAVVARLTDPGLVEDEGWAGRSHVEAGHDAAVTAHEVSRLYLRVAGARRGR